MIYIVVLNWNGAEDTSLCVKSLIDMDYKEYKIIVVDNKSTDSSYDRLKGVFNDYCSENSNFIEVEFKDVDQYVTKDNDKIILISADKNRGYAGGNNIGIKMALNQPDMEYVWVLNNDTEVDKNALKSVVKKCATNNQIGICGSRLIYFNDRTMQQGLGGLHNKWLCTTKHYEMGRYTDKKYDEDIVSDEIDYIIGAAMLFSRKCLESVGLMHEDYFLYYEELDICIRARRMGFKLGVCTDSLVYHKIGASTDGGKSEIADYCSIKNRLLFTRRFFPKYYWLVWSSLLFVALNRLRRKQVGRMKMCLQIMFSFGRY
ncbi:glycosyltransferase family 2 protein [Citrobacter freundii]|uniref:glycosyltransferase family 2 protein n=1 Tax=Citrobacter freundii TaxID=546 RepID=UPI0015C47FA6|nr:glycosyltransferase family 2 protein [Citrobacter freundii]ELN4557038.1 glycosyltransferase family 2 protein [Citrobacter freundii]NWO34923.1 glycosyltransferase family 2 protein [Citrobacter freundii]WOR61879.1 glycosyltransferase family 2 protein [Citrobacter freundii]HBM8268804.1 glycosyltransferase family 2 protein [Citrobacter freundii]HDG1657600.1 glycosyltransferase family 2 protein [Citrobacter freundii]